MFQFLANTQTKRTTLIFPSSDNLWTFFAQVQVEDFRIESNKRVFVGKLQRNDIEFAKRNLGANELYA
jgi:hypothetical protein